MKLKVGACIGAVTMAASLLLTMAPAGADGENANATAIQSTLLDQPIVAAQANCPGTSDRVSTVPITIGNIVIGVAEAHCTDSSARAAVAKVRIFDPSNPFGNTIVLDVIKSSCKSDGTRTSTVTLKTGMTGIVAGPITSPVSLTTGTISIYLNEKFTTSDTVGVNAVRIQLGGPEQNQNLILAQSICHAEAPGTGSSNGGGLLGLHLLGIL